MATKLRVRHNLPTPVTGRVNNVNYIIPPGDEGTIIEDQRISAKDVLDAIKNDFNNSSVNKAVFITEEVIDVDDDNETDVLGDDRITSKDFTEPNEFDKEGRVLDSKPTFPDPDYKPENISTTTELTENQLAEAAKLKNNTEFTTINPTDGRPERSDFE